MVSTPRKTAVKTVDPQFSLLTCLFVGGCFLFLETLVDLVCHIYDSKHDGLYRFIIHTNVRLLDLVGSPHPYAYAIEWWLPVLVGGMFFGYRLGWSGAMYSICGVFIFLIIIHNFRGITMRLDVFDRADTIQRLHSMRLAMDTPGPLFWDIGYFAVAVVGSLFGWLSRLFLPKLLPVEWRIRTVFTLRMGYACFLLGVLEALITLFIVQSEDVYVNLPITHGYAMMAFGLIMVSAVQYRNRLSEVLNFEVL